MELERAKWLRTLSAQLLADVWLYPTEEGGRKQPASLGWGCPCVISKAQPLVGYDAWPLLGHEPLCPGEKRRLGFVFLHSEHVETIRNTDCFYLWEGRFIGEALVVHD